MVSRRLLLAAEAERLADQAATQWDWFLAR